LVVGVLEATDFESEVKFQIFKIMDPIWHNIIITIIIPY